MKIILSVFKNSYKKEGSNQPDYKVTMINDKGGFVSCGGGWIKSTKTGDKYISLSVDTEPEQNAPVAPQGLTEAENQRIKELRSAEQAKPLTNLTDKAIPW